MTQKVMVKLEPNGVPLTYEVDGLVEVGDFVEAPYGWQNVVRPGKVVALGSQPRTYPDGRTEPAWEGYCKKARVRVVENAMILNMLPGWLREEPLPSYLHDGEVVYVCAGCGEPYHVRCPELSGVPSIIRRSEWLAAQRAVALLPDATKPHAFDSKTCFDCEEARLDDGQHLDHVYCRVCKGADPRSELHR